MAKQSAKFSHVFQALADPTRRAVLERLSRGPAPTTELAQPFKMALPSFLQHLDVLQKCGLVRSSKQGRVRTYQLAPQTLKDAEDWLATRRTLWERRLDQLDAFLLNLKEETMTQPTTLKINPQLDLVLERVIDVPPELVWKAWTTPELLMPWFTPAPWKTIDCEIDLRPGGIFRTTMQSPQGQEFPNAGCYLEIVPNQKLVWTSALEPGYRPSNAAEGPFLFSAAILLEPHGNGGTKYTAIAIHRDEAGKKQHEEMGFHAGWGKALDQLVEFVKKM